MIKKSKFYINDLEYYVAGGVDEICKLITKIHGIRNVQSVKKQFEKKDLIIINDFNEFDDILENIVISIAEEVLTIYNYDEIKNNFVSNNLPFGEFSHYDSDANIAVKKMIQLSMFEENEKQELLEAVKKFKLEFSSTEEIFNFYENHNFFELDNFISYVKNQDIELDLRLSELSQFMIKLNKAILKNEEIIKRKSYPHKKDCAVIINKFLKKSLEILKSKLDYYLKSLGNIYQNIGEEREPREFLLHSLIENKQKLDVFLEYERELVEKKYLSKDFSQWLKSPILLVKFYKYCEVNKLFRYNFNNKSKGVKLLRKMYQFYDGESIDKPTKRDRYNKEVKIDYFFLNSIKPN